MISIGLGIFPEKSGWMVYPWLFLTSVGLGVFCVSALAWLNNSVEDSLKGTISGTFYFFWGIGFFSGPLILTISGETTNGFTGFHFLAMLYFLQALAQGIIQYRYRMGTIYQGS